MQRTSHRHRHSSAVDLHVKENGGPLQYEESPEEPPVRLVHFVPLDRDTPILICGSAIDVLVWRWRGCTPRRPCFAVGSRGGAAEWWLIPPAYASSPDACLRRVATDLKGEDFLAAG